MSRITAALLGAVVALAIMTNLALADASPIQLVLLYMPKVSTTDTPGASGIAELVLPESEVRINTTDLPRLDGTEMYAVWIINTDTNEFQHVGDFNTADSTGAVQYENVLPDAIPDKQWNLLLLTVEADTNADHPSDDHSLAAVFPSGNDAPLPGLLPNTGGGDPYAEVAADSRPDWLLTAGLAALTGTLSLGAGYALGHKRR